MSAPLDDSHPVDLHADERGRIIGTMVSIIVITTLAVVLRFMSRKLARAGFWVRSDVSLDPENVSALVDAN